MQEMWVPSLGDLAHTGTFNEYPGLIFFRIRLVGSPCSPRDSQGSSLAPQFESTSSSVFSLLYGPTLISIPDS